MSKFRPLSETMLASPQIAPADIAEARAQGVTLVVNNRPDDEEPGQVAGAEIEQAAREAGLSYLAIPIGHSGFSEAQVAALVRALEETEGKVLAFCRTGTRSTLLWALAQARAGRDPEDVARAAREAGYDVSPIRPAMDMFFAQSRAG